jgi:hypothetical protein
MSRPITFSKMGTLGEWVNHETGVVIQKQTDGSYRPFRPADTSTGYIGISVAKRTLAEAKHEAARYIDGSIRHWMGVAYDEAMTEDAERSADACPDCGVASGDHHEISCATVSIEEFRAELGIAVPAVPADHAEALEDDAAYRQNAEYRHRMQWQRTMDEDHAEALGDSRVIADRRMALHHAGHTNVIPMADAEVHEAYVALPPANAHEELLAEDQWGQLSDDGTVVRTLDGPIVTSAVPVPADLNDDAAWAEYCAALPDPTEAEIAAVLAEHTGPYAEQIAHADEAFRTCARMIWRERATGRLDQMAYAYLRDAMKTYAGLKRIYRTLSEVFALGLIRDAHIAASYEGADAYGETFGTVE